MEGPRAHRFTAEAARALRDAIREAGGVEVFAIADMEDDRVVGVTVTCRGQVDRVPALLDRPRAGQAVVHNHPSGDLTPSDADMALAARYGEDGVGVAIVDSAVRRANWVVEPHVRRQVPVDDAVLEAFFTDALPRVLDVHEPRPQQLEMARRVATALSEGQHHVIEAGTGTGKSLAYLVPAALWAMANDSKVVVSTYTRALQGQLVTADIPLLGRGGIGARCAVLLGRNNYLCKRRLGLAREDLDPARDEGSALLDDVAAWEETAPGIRTELPFRVDPDTWDDVMSDGALTLSVNCPHYLTCHYYTARRDAAAAHVVVVNHALLLADLALREAQGGRGVLPAYTRIVVDEAHHLEDAATGAAAQRLTALGVRRAIAPLLDNRRRRGALTRLVARQGQDGGDVDARARQALADAVALAEATAEGVQSEVGPITDHLAEVAFPDGQSPLRLTDEVSRGEAWRLSLAPSIRRLHLELGDLTERLDDVEGIFQDVRLEGADAQPLLSVRRARRRLLGHAAVAGRMLEGDAQGDCRWIEPARSGRGDRSAALCAAPVDVAASLRTRLWEAIPGVVATSATLAVAGRFDWWCTQVGAPDPVTVHFPSPFDHRALALLGLPRDLPPPNDRGFLDATTRVIVEAVARSDGGAFVLCTSYAAVRHYAGALRGVGDRPVLAQGEAGRTVLLERFRENRRAVLVGTDSFWEGVSVQGEGLRLVIIPRVPFRVPTDPLRVARHERVEASGRDPFRARSLPEAAIRLKQGYGRLIRSHTDRGVVLLLDRRIHDRSYGRVLLASLPPARRLSAPWRRVSEELERFYGAAPGVRSPPGSRPE